MIQTLNDFKIKSSLMGKFSRTEKRRRRKARRSCAVCRKRSAFKCSRCKRTFYCCQRHQTEHWPSHRLKCRVVKRPVSSNGVSPAQCFADCSRMDYDQVVSFVETSLQQVGMCVLDNFCKDDYALCLQRECQALQIKLKMENLELTAPIDPNENEHSLTQNDLKMCEGVQDLFVTFGNLMQRSLEEFAGETKVNNVFSCELPRHNSTTEENQLIHITYYAKRNDGNGVFTRYFITDKIVDVQARYNRVVVSWMDGRLVVENEKNSANLFALSSLYYL